MKRNFPHIKNLVWKNRFHIPNNQLKIDLLYSVFKHRRKQRWAFDTPENPFKYKLLEKIETRNEKYFFHRCSSYSV